MKNQNAILQKKDAMTTIRYCLSVSRETNAMLEICILAFIDVTNLFLFDIYSDNFACSQRNFDILCELIEKSELEDLLKETGTLTLFAPSNEAFEYLGDEVLENLLQDPTGALKDILKYHISDEIYFESDLYCNRQIDTLRGDTSDDFTTTKCKARGAYQKGNGNEKPYPRIMHTDMVACNGVVHVVDKVILPN